MILNIYKVWLAVPREAYRLAMLIPCESMSDAISKSKELAYKWKAEILGIEEIRSERENLWEIERWY